MATTTMIFGKTKYMKKLVIMTLFCFITMLTFGQTKDANSVFVQAEELFSEKNYEDALSKLALYENLSNASIEKAQVLKIQIYRELALKDQSHLNNYNNSVEELKKMFADGKKVNAEDLYRILKEQQEFDKDVAIQNKANLSSLSSDIAIDGITIGMNIEEIPSEVAVNFDWSNGIKGQANDKMNYVPLYFSTKKGTKGGPYNIKLIGIQTIIADDRTRRVIQVFKFLENEKYKIQEKTGLNKYNSMVEKLKEKYGEDNVIVNPKMVNESKVMNKKMVTETYGTIVNSKSVFYSVTYTILNNSTYSIIELMRISDFIKN